VSDARILLASCEQTVRCAMRWALESQGYTCDEVEDGEAALRKIRQGGYELALLENVMPFMGAREVLVEARKIKPGLSVVILGGQPSVNAEPDWRTAVLPKPTTLAQFTALVVEMFSRRAQHKSEM